jgi:hypothetical protein
MYSFAQRHDTLVLDEPFYAVYLDRSKADHPGAAQVLSSLPTQEETVVGEIFKEWSKPVLFIKNMAHHIEVIDKSFLAQMTNIFLIRNPKQIIASYAEVIGKPVMRDIGIEYEYRLFEDLRKQGQVPVVLDSGVLLENPRGVLTKLCAAIGLEFTPAMLRWEAGPKPYDGVWATYWYGNVHRSTGFEKQNSSSRQLPSHLTTLYEEAAPYYEKLLSFAIGT